MTDSEIFDFDCIDETGERSLHNIFDHIDDRGEHVGVDERPDDLGESVEPFDGFGSRRSELFTTLFVHLKTDSFEFLFDLAYDDTMRYEDGDSGTSDQRRTEDESLCSRTESDEEPDDPEETDDTESVGVDGLLDGVH